MYMARSTKAPHAPEMTIPGTGQSTVRPITEAELDVARRELSSGTAPGDDDIHCEELTWLGAEEKKCVVRPFDRSLHTEQVPPKWKSSAIVSLLNPYKPATSTVSVRAVTTTSTLRKLMERIVACCAMYFADDKPQPQHTGFRPARPTLDTLM
ncbi:hypothetical protein ERJ75_000324400 [Trypanosoma vivax]|nr:hypothetical protein TRVL_06551 [Trypanosoma vivax]KAH8617917.1 hypothetical protein ERJ75_000324600 [Trypanosoma vivax]KAH8617955.1 hypothetical protein ERJ75_000324400 [Trypanosoma vivax]